MAATPDTVRCRLAFRREQQPTLTARQDTAHDPPLGLQPHCDVGGGRSIQPNLLRQCLLVESRLGLQHAQHRILHRCDFVPDLLVEYRHRDLLSASYQVSRLVVEVDGQGISGSIEIGHGNGKTNSYRDELATRRDPLMSPAMSQRHHGGCSEAEGPWRASQAADGKTLSGQPCNTALTTLQCAAVRVNPKQAWETWIVGPRSQDLGKDRRSTTGWPPRVASS
jgi:hypothetical protein